MTSGRACATISPAVGAADIAVVAVPVADASGFAIGVLLPFLLINCAVFVLDHNLVLLDHNLDLLDHNWVLLDHNFVLRDHNFVPAAYGCVQNGAVAVAAVGAGSDPAS